MSWQMRLKLTPNTVPASGAGLTDRIRQRFLSEAGELIRTAIQDILGEDALYTLSPEYAKRKPRLKKFVRFPGKAKDQPIILSANLYFGIEWRISGNAVTIQVADSRGIDDGFDYAEFWEQNVDYLGKGFDDVANQLPGMLEQIVVDEMLL